MQLYCYRYSPGSPLYKAGIPGHQNARFLKQRWLLGTKYSWIFLPFSCLTTTIQLICSPLLATHHRFCIPPEVRSIWLCTGDRNIHL